MNKILATMLSLILVFTIVSAGYAQAPDPGQATSFGAVQNVGTGPADFRQDFYGSDGTLVAFREQAGVAQGDSMGLTPNDNVDGAPLNVEVPAGFKGSSVVSSNETAAAVVLIQWSGGQIGDGVTTADYVGEVNPGDDIFCPSVGNLANEDSTIVVMNTSDAAVDDVVISFKDRDGADAGTPITGVNIPAYSQKEFNLVEDATLPAGFLGAARVESAGGTPLAVVAVTHWGGAAGAYGSFAYNCAPTDAAATTVYAPKVQRRVFGGSWFDASGIVVVNTEDTDATVEVGFYDRAGTVSGTFTDTVPAFSARGYNTRYVGNADADVIEGMIGDGTTDEPNWQGSAVVESLTGHKIVGVVKQGYDTQFWAAGYNMLSDADAAQEWSFPLVYRRGFSKPWTDYAGLICQNVSDVDIEPELSFVARSGDQCTADDPCKFTDPAPYGEFITHGFNTRYGGGIGADWFETSMGEIQFLGAATASIASGQMVCIQETWAEEIFVDGAFVDGGDANLNNAYGQ